MSLVAFCFMGGGGLGTAIGGRIIGTYRLERLFWVYGLALLITLLLSYVLIRDHVVEENELLEQVVQLRTIKNEAIDQLSLMRCPTAFSRPSMVSSNMGNISRIILMLRV
jgi:hypothetical protein